MTVPVHVVAGFLGAGKTSALLHQLALRQGREKVAVLVNDFGDASIDREVLSTDGGVSLTEIRGACVCCTAPEGFTGALGTLLDEVRPDRIFVEPTGLARPADVVDTLRRGPHKDRVALGPLVVLVDPATLDDDPVRREQAEAADVLVANRVDLASPQALDRFRAWAGALWPGPLRVVETERGRLDADVFDWPEGEGARRERPAGASGGAHHDYVAGSRIWPQRVVFSRERVLAALGAASGSRIKGLFRTSEGVLRIERSGADVDVRPTSWRRDSRVDVLMPRGGAPGEVLDALDAAVLTDAEREIDATRVEVVRPDRTRVSFDLDAVRALPGGIDDVSAVIPKRAGAAARLTALLSAARIPDGDHEVVVLAADGFATPPVPRHALDAGLLVHSLGSDPLPGDKGGPFRLLVPGDAGPGGPCANVKGVVRIVVR